MPDRKTFLFFNCLLDGMHTSRKASKGFNLPKNRGTEGGIKWIRSIVLFVE
ncbi:hypothetical protein GCWU000342_00115 [Shuttleworthella satelles DSM 14600]|uniref:Uncharacterized protein n=1 Tax=Shuttleworthella satelles DSM 14600 TaxID=626523 RepID=C4G7X8_9FIRM|nr:hypothetical protein GCWU000342_00115 [Shuttleworthia satelles DSM 14600]